MTKLKQQLKLVLELGGKSALVYLKGGDMDKAIKSSVNSIANNQGLGLYATSRS